MLKLGSQASQGSQASVSSGSPCEKEDFLSGNGRQMDTVVNFKR